MDKLLNPDEIRLQELLETQYYNTLSETDKAFVQTQCGEDTYRLHRRIIVQTSEPTEEAVPFEVEAAIFAHLDSEQPKEDKKVFVLAQRIPAYYSIAAVAATALIVILLWPAEEKGRTVTEYVYQDRIVEQTDTVYQTVATVDTIKQTEYVRVEVPVTVYVTRDEPNNPTPQSEGEDLAYDIVAPQPTVSLPDFNSPDLENKGTQGDDMVLDLEQISSMGLRDR